MKVAKKNDLMRGHFSACHTKSFGSVLGKEMGVHNACTYTEKMVSSGGNIGTWNTYRAEAKKVRQQS